MSYSGLTQDEERRMQMRAAAQAATPDDMAPSFFEGTGLGISQGFQRAAVGVTSVTAKGLNAAGLLSDEETDRTLDTNARVIDTLRNDPNVGTFGRVAGALSEIGPVAVAGTVAAGPVGGALAVGGFVGSTDYDVSTRVLEIDPATAAEKALLTGAVNGLGVLLPAGLGTTLATRVSSGVAVNVTLGGVDRAGSAAILESGGYADIAQQYRVWDGEAIAIDAVLGAAFGGISRLGQRDGPSPVDVDKAFDAQQQYHVNVDTAPGLFKTPEAADAHFEAMQKAAADIDAGRPVDVGELGPRVEDLLPDPRRSEFANDMDEALKPLTKEVDARPEDYAEPRRPEITEPAPRPAPRPPTKEGEGQIADVDAVARQKLEQTLAARPDLEIKVEDGRVIKASEFMKEIDAKIEQSVADARLHEVAIACFLRGN